MNGGEGECGWGWGGSREGGKMGRVGGRDIPLLEGKSLKSHVRLLEMDSQAPKAISPVGTPSSLVLLLMLACTPTGPTASPRQKRRSVFFRSL